MQLGIGSFSAALQQASQMVQAFAASAQAPLVSMNATLQSMAQQMQSVTAGLQQVTTGLQQVNSAGNNLRHTSDALRTIFAIAGGVGLATNLQSIVRGLRDAAVEAVGTAIKMQALQASFVAIAGSVSKASAELSFLRQVATRTGTDFFAVAGSFKSLEAAALGTSLQGEKVHRIFDAVATASRVMGLDAQQTQRALLALEQMISKGTISAEELRRQLGNALPGALQIMARAVGVSSAELLTMMRRGELLAEDVLPKFGDQIQRQFGPGLERAVKTAAASFALLGNETRDVFTRMGTAILAALQPAADLLTRMLRDMREAKERADRDVARRGTELVQGQKLPGFQGTAIDLPNAASDAERAKLTALAAEIASVERAMASIPERAQAMAQARIETLKREFALVNSIVERRQDERDIFQDNAGVAGAMTAIQERQERVKKQVQDLLDLHKKLPDEIQRAVKMAALMPAMYEKADAQLDVVKENLREYEKLIEKHPHLIDDAQVQDALAKTNVLAKSLQDQLDAQKKAKEDAKDAAREAERLEKERFRNAEQLSRERIRVEETMSLAITGATQGEAEKQIEAMQKVLFEARRTGAEETTIAQYEATERERIRAEEVRKAIEIDRGKLAAIRGRVSEQLSLEKLITDSEVQSTRTRLDDFLADQERKRLIIEDAVRQEKLTTEDLERFKRNTAAGAARIVGEEHEKAKKDAAKQWREFANTIEGTLASTFNSVLQGSKTLFEGLRSAFLSLLAKLAADALTPIIIRAIIQFVGGGGGGGGGLAGAAGAGSLFTGAGLADGASGSSASGGGTLGQAIGLVSAGNSISGAIGGPSIGLGSGGFGASLAATELGRLPFIGGALGGPGAGVAGPTTALGAATVGQVVGGIGAGIAVGMILSQINKLIGFGGTGSAVAAGAGGGAAAGALIGTAVFPVIGSGIGAAIGTAVGALGGYLSTLFSKDKKQPGFDIEALRPGQVEYDTSLGLRIRENFKILDDFHQKLGTDYEDFIAVMDDSINDMFAQVVAQVSGASPEVQRALVGPLNAAFGEVAGLIQDYPKIGGEDFKKQLEVMMQDFAGIFENSTTGAINELMEAVAKIDPVVKAFTQIIDSLLEDIQELGRQQQALNDALDSNIQTLRESLMSPAEILGVRKQEYAALLGQFEGGDEATRIALAPRIGELSTAILELTKTVLAQSFGDLSGIQAGIKTLQESLYTPQQSLGARQNDLARLLEEFRGGTQSIRAVLAPQITQLALQIMELSKGVTTLAEQEAKLADQQAQAAQRQQLMADFPQQIRAITEGLFSPAQQYLSGRQQLTELMAQFRGSTPDQQLAMEPQIAQLTAEILNLARGVDVLGQDPQLLRQTQSELLGVMREVQQIITVQAHNDVSETAQLQGSIDQTRITIENTQAQMIGVLREVEYVMASNIVAMGQQTIQAIWSTAGQIISTDYAMTNGIITAQYYTTNGVVTAQYNATGQLINTEHYIGGALQGTINNTSSTVAGWSNALYQQQDYLIGQVTSVRDVASSAYGQLIDALWTEIGIAQQEIQLLVDALYHLETVDAVVARALGVLGEMNARLGNPLNVNMGESLMTQLQRNSIDVAQRTLNMQGNANRTMIALLAKPAFGLSWDQGMQLGRDVVGFQHGGVVPRNMMGFLHAGERVVPEWESRGSGGGGRNVTIAVYGGTKDPGQIAETVVKLIEQRSGRLHTSTIQTSRR
ncbi:MAG TPA: tape measure protein [Candidatus Tectomicrobia bacterium]